MDSLVSTLPPWMILLVVLFWVFWDKILPRINRKGRTSMPPSASATPPTAAQAQAETTRLADELHKERSAMFSSISRFETAMDRLFETNRQQTALLKTIAEGFEADRRTSQLVQEILLELRSTVRVVSSTQEAIMRRLEDTGRHNLPNARGG